MKPPCEYPLDDGRRCCECSACHTYNPETAAQYGRAIGRLRAENERLRHDALTVYGIVYEQLTAGVVDDHDRIMRATNELAEAGRRFAVLSSDEVKA